MSDPRWLKIATVGFNLFIKVSGKLLKIVKILYISMFKEARYLILYQFNIKILYFKLFCLKVLAVYGLWHG